MFPFLLFCFLKGSLSWSLSGRIPCFYQTTCPGRDNGIKSQVLYDCTCLVSAARRSNFSPVAKLYPETIVFGTQTVGAYTSKHGCPNFRRTSTGSPLTSKVFFCVIFNDYFKLFIKWRRCSFLVHWFSKFFGQNLPRMMDHLVIYYLEKREGE